MVIEVIIEVRGIFEAMEWLLDNRWDGFYYCLGTGETYVFYDGINEGMLCEFIGASIMLSNIDAGYP